MKLNTILFGFFLSISILTDGFSQVSVMHNDPKSILDMQAVDRTNASFNDGLLIPRVENFPAVNPGADQDGMLVFLNTTQTGYKKGHYFWDNDKVDWIHFGSEWQDGYNGSLEDLTYLKQAFTENEQDVVLLDNGRLGMGTDNPEESLEIRLPGDNDIQVSSVTPPNAPNIIFYTKGGSFDTPDFLNNNDPINALTAKAWSGTSKTAEIATISTLADGDHGLANLPTKYVFSVTKNGDNSETNSGNEMTLKSTGKLGIGIDNPTAFLHVKAGGPNANQAPMKMTAGPLLTTPEAGTLEYDGSELYFTPSTTRKKILKGLKGTQTLNFPSIITNQSAEASISVTGAMPGSSCNCTPHGAIEVGVKWSCYVSAPNTATIRLSNVQNVSVTLAPRVWTVTVIE